MRARRNPDPGRYELPEFLQSLQAARAWARRRNQGVGNTDCYECEGLTEEQILRQRLQVYLDQARKIAHDGSATIYRHLRVPRVRDPRTVIDWDCLGTSWTWDPDLEVEAGSSEVLDWEDVGLREEDTEGVVLEARVGPDAIWWEAGLKLYCEYGEEESEIPLRDREPVEVLRILRHGRFVKVRYSRPRPIVLDPPVIGNTGQGAAIWSLSSCAARWKEKLASRFGRRKAVAR